MKSTTLGKVAVLGSVKNGHKHKFGLDLSWTVTEEERTARLIANPIAFGF